MYVFKGRGEISIGEWGEEERRGWIMRVEQQDESLDGD